MIEYVNISAETPEAGCKMLLEKWANPETKVVVTSVDGEIDDVRDFYESIFPLIGKPEMFAEDATKGDRNNQRTGEVWMEIRYDPTIENAYRHSSNAQPLHTDGSYIPGFPNSSLLCCVRNAGKGGETVFVNSKDVVELAQQDCPELLEKLLSQPIPHARSGDRRVEKIFYKVDGIWKVNWNYYCVSQELSEEQRAIVEEFHQFVNNSGSIRDKLVEVKLKPGEAVMWKDNEVLHGRNSFEASSSGERFIWKCAFDVGVFE